MWLPLSVVAEGRLADDRDIVGQAQKEVLQQMAPHLEPARQVGKNKAVEGIAEGSRFEAAGMDMVGMAGRVWLVQEFETAESRQMLDLGMTDGVSEAIAISLEYTSARQLGLELAGGRVAVAAGVD